MTEHLRWNIQDDPNRQIASVNIFGFDELKSSVSRIFNSGSVPYSGIILSNAKELASGEGVEANCYSKGGFRFVYKSYDGGCFVDNFPTNQIINVVNTLGTSYLREVEGISSACAKIDVAWAVCQRDGDYGTIHNHVSGDANIETRYSGMLYLSTPDCVNPNTFPNGCLHIVVDNKAFYMPPVPGLFVIWPSWMMHGIHPFRGEGDRLGIAFDFNRVGGDE